MAETTPLDRAIAVMAAKGTDAARLSFYGVLADTELMLLLDAEPTDDAIAPRLQETDAGTCVVAFDLEERLADFAGGDAQTARLPGRVLAALAAEQGMGIALNPGGAPTSHIVPPDAVRWLAETLSEEPEEAPERPVEALKPSLPPEALEALGRALSRAPGLAAYALLTRVRYHGGREGHLLTVIDPRPGSEDALVRAVSEALTFSGAGEAAATDVTFLAGDSPAAARLAKVALRLDVPEAPATRPAPAPPGSDPDKPPRLR
ncbi:SseB family protein [Wenxinia marina]|uniref:SseB protein N-terminal domain-containing protein n=1 Tax=Wenxinia marina DSM 24838 TaxID=1123501 RepID=A0A0D0NQ99_9RHOB|nr:SseB family protein [Wenxinia marina]KIQ70450.1 hypothetical protein Wenmar_00826 [Wenxinia marina DSM 24838]GGL53058.1 hypothetical protein GCM10011392_04270 [Wenxinia marina]